MRAPFLLAAALLAAPLTTTASFAVPAHAAPAVVPAPVELQVPSNPALPALAPEVRMSTTSRCVGGTCLHTSTRTAVGSTPALTSKLVPAAHTRPARRIPSQTPPGRPRT